MKRKDYSEMLFGAIVLHFVVSIALTMTIANWFVPNSAGAVVAVIGYQFLMHTMGVTAVLALLEKSS